MRVRLGKYFGRVLGLLAAGALGVAEVSAGMATGRWASPELARRMESEFKALFDGGATRLPGAPGNLALEERVAQRFAKTGLPHGEMRFTAPVFLPGWVELDCGGGLVVKATPLHSTLFRPGNFAAPEFNARLVYLGKGTGADMMRLAGVPLAGAIGVMDFDSGAAWLDWLRLGIKGFVFLEPPEYTRFDAMCKVYGTEVSVPRFLACGEAARHLREAAEKGVEARVRAKPSRWENRVLRNLWVLIPGSDPNLSGEVAVFTAPLDANCVAPELAVGAQSAGNLLLLLRMLDLFSANPPARSVLLAAVNAHTQNFKGERVFGWHLLADRSAIEEVRNTINADLRINQALLKHYGALRLEKFDQTEEDTLVRWRALVDESTGRNLTVKNALVRLIKRDVNRVKSEIGALSFAGLPPDEEQARRKRLLAEKEKYVHILTLFNKVGRRTLLRDLTPDEVAILRGYVQQVLEFNRVCAEINAVELENELANGAVRDALHGRRVVFVVALDGDWQSENYGFITDDPAGDKRWAKRWGVNAAEIGARLSAASGGKNNLIVDTTSMRGGLSEGYYCELEFSYGEIPSVAAYFQTFNRTPAFVMRNVFSRFGRAFLPTDTPVAMPWANFAEAMVFLPSFWREFLNDPYVTASSQLGVPGLTPAGTLRSIQIKTYKFDELAASVLPEIPVPNTAVILRPMLGAWGGYMPLERCNVIYGDVINADLAMTDLRASTIVYGLPADSLYNKYTSGAFHFDADFVAVDHVINAGGQHSKVDSNRLNANMTMALFECTEFPVYAAADSSLVGNLPIAVQFMMALTAKGNAAPRNFGLTGVMSPLTTKMLDPAPGAPIAYYLDGRERFKLVTGDKRVALNATPEEPEGRGYISPDEFDNDFFYMAARDASVLNHGRLKKLRAVAGDLAYEFLQRGDALLKDVAQARAVGDHIKYLRKLYEALGAHAKSYEQVKQTTDDMLKAVVVYMALLLPFCFFLQKLLFNFVKIEHEMGMFAVLFVLTFLVFRVIHPAFRVAQAAEAIFIAFVMGVLGLFVISILRGRFEGEMQMLFRTFTASGMDEEVGYSTVTQKAMLIGVNNMKRRRIRTMLTTATIVLIAFSMLSFTSISKKVNPTIVPRGKDAPYTGIMYHWPGKSPMDENTFVVMRNILSAFGQVLARHWLVSRSDNMPFRLYNPAAQSEVRLDGLLGLSTAEDGFLETLPLVAGRNFSSDDAREALIFASMADVLGITTQNMHAASLRLGDMELKVVGILDDALFKNMRDLNGLPLLPIKRMETESGSDAFNPLAKAKTSPTEDIHDMGALFFVETSALLVLPGGMARQFGARPYSISLKLPEQSEGDSGLWKLAEFLLTSTSARFYIGSRAPFAAGADGRQTVAAGIYYIGSNYSTAVGGLALLLIPLFIAATIILNTMLGSVYERKKEIAVYNAIGLNPHHIGTFFLAESFVYGVIGSVGGYLIGQVMSTLIVKFNLVPGINFNYSSLSVAYVILFTIAIVLLSTIYPAAVATRAAVPSGKRRWSLPPQEGGRMRVVFPFIYTPQIAGGIVVYLWEYFSRFTAASIGDLIATLRSCRRGVDARGRPCYWLDYHVALAPYDLGVTENLHFYLAFDEHVQAYQLTLEIERISGQDTNWKTTNRPFLERLRKYLMHWRNLDLAQQQVYARRIEELAAGSKRLDAEQHG